MARYAQLDLNNKVVNVILADESFITSLPNSGSYIIGDAPIGTKKLDAQIGMIYNLELNAFIEPQPYPSWKLNILYQWEPPVEYPTTVGVYEWNETEMRWISLK